MIKRIIAGIAASAITVTAFALPASATTTARPVNWTQRTCDAFTAWQGHPSVRNLDTLVIDSLSLRHGYLASDVADLLAAVVTAKPNQHHIDTSAEYVAQDCSGGL
jgi:hypothetical protein